MASELDLAVSAALRGDEQGFAAVYRELQPPLLRYLRVLVRDEAPDVAAETWVQVTRDLQGFRGDGTGFRAWVLTIGRHRAMDHLRQHRRRPSEPWNPAELPEPAPAPDAGVLTEEALATRRALEQIAALPRDQAEAVLLRAVLGLDAPTAAKVLGKRAGAVRMATSRGLATLRAELESVTPQDPAAL